MTVLRLRACWCVKAHAKIEALRDIASGEELYLSYGEVRDMSDNAHELPTS